MSDLGNKEIFAKNLQYYMSLNKKSRNDVCRDLEIPYSTFTDWYNANIYPRIDKIQLLANYFGIQKSDLVESKSNDQIIQSNSALVFVYGTIPAGIPMECIEDVMDTEEISIDMLRGGKQYFGLRVKGNSMEPEYLDGDTLILEKVDDCESGDDCVVMVNGNDGTFKRVFKNENGIILQPLNPSYSPMVYTNEQIETLPIKILGIVVEFRRKKRKK
jgi:repressor LexA|nr:MAG TPA: Repressor protein CI [Caudoviricetes sp.]